MVSGLRQAPAWGPPRDWQKGAPCQPECTWERVRGGGGVAGGGGGGVCEGVRVCEGVCVCARACVRVRVGCVCVRVSESEISLFPHIIIRVWNS